jgi:peptide/nickel transport system permease protein
LSALLELAARRLVRSRRATMGVAALGSVALVAVFADALAADRPLAGAPSGSIAAAEKPSPPADLSRACARHEGAGTGATGRADAPGLWPPIRWGPNVRSAAGACAPPSREHPLGTDATGRDLAARLVHGARSALGLALGATLLGALLGLLLGGLAGYRRGFWNDRLVRLVETVDTFPAILVVALLRAIEREPTALSLVFAIALVRWAEVARLVRAEVLRETAEEHVLAAQALGGSDAQVFVRHVLPSAALPVATSAVFGLGTAVLLEAAVSFLGLGTPATSTSWGEILAEGAANPNDLRLVLLPAAGLLATVGGAFLLADALRDALDPRAPR